jgi:hypothetical protein
VARGRGVITLNQKNVRTELLRGAEIVNECRRVAGLVQGQAKTMNPEADYRLEKYRGRTRDWWGVEDRLPGAISREAKTGALARAVRSVQG